MTGNGKKPNCGKPNLMSKTLIYYLLIASQYPITPVVKEKSTTVLSQLQNACVFRNHFKVCNVKDVSGNITVINE